MTQRKILESLNFQRLAHDWQHEINLSEPYFKYCSSFSNMIMNFISMWNGPLGRISISKRRIKNFGNSDPACLASIKRVQRTGAPTP